MPSGRGSSSSSSVLAEAIRAPSPEIVGAIERLRPLAFRVDGLITALIGAALVVQSV